MASRVLSRLTAGRARIAVVVAALALFVGEGVPTGVFGTPTLTSSSA
jgi:hypothetical protein